MKTPKIHKLNNLIDFLNNKFSELNLVKLGLNECAIESNYWLTGMIEADGCFSVVVSKNLNINCKFRLTQSSTNHMGFDKKSAMTDLSNFLNVKVGLKKDIRYDNYFDYVVSSGSLVNNLILNNYLEKYPLFSGKFLNLSDRAPYGELLE